MASLQELRKRLRSIRSTQKLAEAMVTAASAKHSRILRLREEFTPYARACGDMLRQTGGGLSSPGDEGEGRDALVLLGGNRGLCGGFNQELLRFFDALLSEYTVPPLLIVCGKKAAAHLRDRGLPAEEFPLSDIPDYREIRALCARLETLYRSGEAERVRVVYQSYKNTLIQTPAVRCLLPGEGVREEQASDNPPLYLPDRAAIGERLGSLCLYAGVYDLALENAIGAQAATVMAMRSACDNARDSASRLEITINRRRQAEVTASVIETAAGSAAQGE